MFKRIVLFLATNFAILVVLNIVLGVLSASGLLGKGATLGQYQPFLIIAAVMGFGGSLISLLLSKWIAKKSTGAQVIETPRNNAEAFLFDTVNRQAQQAGINMPEIAIYDAPEMNAFATGPSRNNALVAVSTGLLNRLDKRELEAVLGHEMSHVANGDMVTLTMIQGVVNTFVIFGSYVIGNLVDQLLFRREDDRERGRGPAFYLVRFMSEIVLGFLATLLVMWFSRQREFRADSGGARLGSRDGMISALRTLSQNHPSSLPESLTAFGIAGKGSLLSLLSSHPPLEERILRLQEHVVA